MRDVNWWLMTLAFLLGLVLTLGLMIRRVTREVPVTHTVSAGLRGAVDLPEVKKPGTGDVAGKVAAAGAVAASGAAAKLSGAAEKVEHAIKEAGAEVGHAAEKVGDKISGKDILEEDPYGSGSIRVTRRVAGPAGYTVKGDKDTGRYFSPGSPEYDTVEAEVWFANEESAEKAGFLRWDAKGAVPGFGGAVAAAAVKFASVDDVVAGPHGKGSATANADGSGPAGWTIKGNADSMLYHTTESPWYGQTIAEVWFFDEETAHKAGFTRWDKKGETKTVMVAAIADVPAGPYGKGSATANADGSGPAGWLIKGNANSMLYHPPTSSAYNETIAEVWFFDEATAEKAGFEPWDKNFR